MNREVLQMSAWEGPRAVKVWCEEGERHPTIVLVRDEAELQHLAEALREFVEIDHRFLEEDGPEHPGLTDWLTTERGFTVPCTYSAHWPFERVPT
jgi:hypothetical protein